MLYQIFARAIMALDFRGWPHAFLQETESQMKGKIPHTKFNIHSVKSLIVAQVRFVQVLLFCEGKFD